MKISTGNSVTVVDVLNFNGTANCWFLC